MGRVFGAAGKEKIRRRKSTKRRAGFGGFGRSAGCSSSKGKQAPMSARTISSKNQAAIAALYEQGLTDAQMAQKLGISRRSCLRWRNRRGLPVNQTQTEAKAVAFLTVRYSFHNVPLFMSDSEILSSWRKAESHKNQIQILADLNACSVETVLEKLESLGVDVLELKLSLMAQKRKIDPERAIRLYRNGATDVTIARAMGVTAKSIREWRNKMGLAPNFNEKRTVKE